MLEFANAMVRVAIWARTSDKKKKDSDAIKDQIRKARRRAKKLGATVVEACIYQSEGLSGGKLRDALVVERLRDDVAHDMFDILIVPNIERFSRDTLHALELVEYLSAHGVTLLAVDGGIDISTPEGRLDFATKSALAQYGREKSNINSKNALKSRLESAQEGEYHRQLGGHIPFGYALDDGRFVPDPLTSPLRIELYSRFLAAPNLEALANWLNSLGFRTRKGKLFRDTDMRDMLEDPIAKGQRRLNTTAGVPGKKLWVKKPCENWVYAKIAPIIEEELWDACQALLANLEIGRPKLGLCSGKVFCSSCDPEGSGRKLYARSSQKRMRCGKCKLEVSEAEIEELVQHCLGRYTSGALHITRNALELEIQRIEALIKTHQKALTSLKASSSDQQDLIGESEAQELLLRFRQRDAHLEHLASAMERLKRKVGTLQGRDSFELSIPELWAQLDVTGKNLALCDFQWV